MKKILQICDVEGWAIDTLAKGIVKHNPHYDWKRIFLHPKDLEQGKYDLSIIKQDIMEADIIDAQYWRTLSQLMEMIPEIREKKIILTHHNEKNLLSYDWKDVNLHVAKTKYSVAELSKVYSPKSIVYIPNSFNPDIFSFIDDFNPPENIVGYVGRIAPWKGLKGVAEACYELGYPLMIMGKHDKPTYFSEIPQEHRDNIRWDFFNCPDDARVDFYKNITCYVGNSGSGREVGTLGFIEALAMGVPVITTRAGLADDIGIDDENMILVDYDDVDQLKESIQRVMESKGLQSRLRKAGWETIRNYNDERMALMYRKEFNKLMYDTSLVSVVVPATLDRLGQVDHIIESMRGQTYRNLEVVIVLDQAYDGLEAVDKLRDFYSKEKFVVKVFTTNCEGGYNLAIARNIGVIESDGKFIMFCDSRIKPEKNAISEFLKVMYDQEQLSATKRPIWAFGDKGGNKEHFVENFSFIKRGDIIKAGMFLERITEYGAMSQELRERFASQGFLLKYCPEITAEQTIKSSLSPEKRKGIINSKNLLYKLGY